MIFTWFRNGLPSTSPAAWNPSGPIIPLEKETDSILLCHFPKNFLFEKPGLSGAVTCKPLTLASSQASQFSLFPLRSHFSFWFF